MSRGAAVDGCTVTEIDDYRRLCSSIGQPHATLWLADHASICRIIVAAFSLDEVSWCDTRSDRARAEGIVQKDARSCTRPSSCGHE